MDIKMKHSTNLAYLTDNSFAPQNTSDFYTNQNLTFERIEIGLKPQAADGENNRPLIERNSVSTASRQMYKSELISVAPQAANACVINDFKCFTALIASLGASGFFERIGEGELDMGGNNLLKKAMLEDAPQMPVIEYGIRKFKYLTIQKSVFNGEDIANSLPFAYFDNEFGFYLPFCQFPFEQFINSPFINSVNKCFEDYNSPEVQNAVKKYSKYIYEFFLHNYPNGNPALNGMREVLNDVYRYVGNANYGVPVIPTMKKCQSLFPVKVDSFRRKVLLIESENPWVDTNTNIFVGSTAVYAQNKHYFVVSPVTNDFILTNGEAGMRGVSTSVSFEGNEIKVFSDDGVNVTEYKKSKGEVVVVEAAPMIVTYPKLPSNMVEYWKKHMLYFSKNYLDEGVVPTLTFEPCVIKDGREETINAHDSEIESKASLEASYKFSCFLSESPYDYIKISYGGDAVGCLYFDKSKITLPAVPIVLAPETLEVALDFGSTNTTKKANPNGDGNLANVYQKHQFFETLSYDTNKTIENNKSMVDFTFCVDGDNAPGKIPSYAQMFKNFQPNDMPLPMIEGRIYALNNTLIGELVTLEFEHGNNLSRATNIYTDLKLNGYTAINGGGFQSPPALVFLRDCIEELLINSFSYGCAVPKILVSYPSNDPDIFTSDERCWRDIAEYANTLVSYQNSVINTPVMIKESVAVAAYHVARNVIQQRQKNVTVDIGGGTTDISLFCGNNAYTSSFKFAGNNILRNSARALAEHNLNNRANGEDVTTFTDMFNASETVVPGTYDTALNRANANDLGSMSCVFDHCLNRGTIKTSNQNNMLPIIVKIKYLALMFYVKKWVKACQERGVETFNGINNVIFVGGGSLALRTVCQWSERLIEQTLLDISNRADNFRVTNTGNPDKPEVVEGLFHARNINECEIELPYIQDDDITNELVGEIFDELVADINAKLDAAQETRTLKGYLAALSGVPSNSAEFIRAFERFKECVQNAVYTNAVDKHDKKCQNYRMACVEKGENEDAAVIESFTNTYMDVVGLTINAFAEFFDKMCRNGINFQG